MASEHHQNPIFSIISGASVSLYAYLQTNAFLIENALEGLKVILFGVIGGACGYIGKYLMEQFIAKVKEKTKNKCK